MDDFRNGFITGAVIVTITIAIALSVVSYRGSDVFDRLIIQSEQSENGK